MSLLRSKGWLASLQTLSTQFISKIVSRGSKFRKTDKKETEHGKSEPGPAKKHKKRGGAGAWRAFVHHHCKGQQFGADRITELAHTYKELSPQEKQFFVEAGEAGVRARHAGFKAFHQESRKHKKKKQTSAIEDDVGLQPGDVTESGAIIAVDQATLLKLAVKYDGRDLFLQGYDVLKQELAARNAVLNQDSADVLDEFFEKHFVEEENNKLAEFEKSVSHASAASFILASGHDIAASSLDNVGARSSQLVSLNWFPPVANICQARTGLDWTGL